MEERRNVFASFKDYDVVIFCVAHKKFKGINSVSDITQNENKVTVTVTGNVSEFLSKLSNLHPIDLSEEKKINVEDHSVFFLEAEHFELMQNLPISLFINIASMQEMDLPVINLYFKYMQTSKVGAHFYYCNRVKKRCLMVLKSSLRNIHGGGKFN